MPRSRNHHTRNSGQALAEGAVSIMLVSALGMATLLFLLDCFLTSYCLLKVQFVALNAAQHLASLPNGANEQQEVERFAGDLLGKFGMSLAHPPRCQRRTDYAVVTICANSPGLLGSRGLFLPVLGQLNDTEISTPQSNKAVAWLNLEFNSSIYGPADVPQPGSAGSSLYLPILSLAQTDTSKTTYMMLDTAFWPQTHVIYHAAYAGFPAGPGPTGGTFVETNGQSLAANSLITSQLGGHLSGIMESLLSQYPTSKSSLFPYPASTAQQKISDCVGTPPAIQPPCGMVWQPGQYHLDPSQPRNLVQQSGRFEDALQR